VHDESSGGAFSSGAEERHVRGKSTGPTGGAAMSGGWLNGWAERAPHATFDLHGQTALEAAGNAERFLRAQARVRPGAVVRLITGRGRGGGGAPIRTRVRTLLRQLRDSDTLVRDFELEHGEGSFLVRLR
jgi:hypothetical protein